MPGTQDAISPELEEYYERNDTDLRIKVAE